MNAAAQVRNPGTAGARVLCAVLGAGYVVIGVIGLAQTGAASFEGTESVGGLGGTTVLNIVHTAMGALALAAALSAKSTRVYGLTGLVYYLGLSAYSVVALIAGAENEPLGVSWPSTVLHVATIPVCWALVVLSNRGRAQTEPEAARHADRTTSQ